MVRKGNLNPQSKNQLLKAISPVGGEPRVSPTMGSLVVMLSGIRYLSRKVANSKADMVDLEKSQCLFLSTFMRSGREGQMY